LAEEIKDLVDEHFRPFVRPLGNLVIVFALTEAALLDLVTAMRDDNEHEAVAVLKTTDAKSEVIALASTLNLSGYDREELLNGIESFWSDKQMRNRLVHDEWFPSLYQLGTVKTRGLTRSKIPKEIFGTPDVAEVWELAARLQSYESLFSYVAYETRRERKAKHDDG
jgi:hypothetical protein